MSHHSTEARTQTYRRAPRRGLLAATLATAIATSIASSIASSIAAPDTTASAAPDTTASAQAYAGPRTTQPGRTATALTVTYSYVDTNRDGRIDKVVLVDHNVAGSHLSTGTGAASTAKGAATRVAPPAVAKLTKQLAAAKLAAAKATAAKVKAQRTAAVLAKAAKVASAKARTARQRAYARQLAKKAAVAARVATTANARAKAAASLVNTLKKSIDKINRVANTTTPTTNAPKPATPVTPPANAPVTTVQTTGCDNLAATFRPVPVTSQWEVSCVNSFPGVSTEPGYTVLGLTRFDSGAGVAKVMVLRSQSAAQLPATFAHELAHAYSITSMNSSQRAVFVSRIRAASLTSANDFFSQSVSYDAMPAEIWARTQASCVGYPAPKSPFTEANCSDVEAAKRA